MNQPISHQQQLEQFVNSTFQMQNHSEFLSKLFPLLEAVRIPNLRKTTNKNKPQFTLLACKNPFVSQEVQKALLISLIHFGLDPVICLEQVIEGIEGDPETDLPTLLSQKQLTLISCILQTAQDRNFNISEQFFLCTSSFYPEEGKGSALHLAILRLQPCAVLLLLQKGLTLTQKDSHGWDAIAIFETAVSSCKKFTKTYPDPQKWTSYQERFRATLEAMSLPPEQAGPLMETINSFVD